MVKDMLRFERDFARFQRCAKEAVAEGASDGAITAAVNEAVAGHPEMQKKLLDFAARLTSASGEER